MPVSIRRFSMVLAAPALCALAAISCQSAAPAVSKAPIGADAVVAEYKNYRQMAPDHLELMIKVAECVGEVEMRRRAETERTLACA